MNAAAVQIEAAQLGLVQRTQKYLDGAALQLVESATAAPQGGQAPSAAPPPRTPPVQPISAAPREGSSIHVIA